MNTNQLDDDAEQGLPHEEVAGRDAVGMRSAIANFH